MGQKVLFDGKIETEPTAKARIISGVSNIGAPSSFGNILMIDTGLGAGFGGGVGILDSGGNPRQLTDFLSRFSSSADMKTFVKGGILFDLADHLYNPSNQLPGASTVYFAKAAQTAKASQTGAYNGTFTIKFNTKEEGLIANGVLEGTDLKLGYAMVLSAGVVDSAKFIFKFFRGTFRGEDTEGLLFDGLTAAQAAANPLLISQSNELTTVEELIAFINSDSEFQKFFELDPSSATTGTFAAADLVTFAGFNLFAGGTETYSTAALDAILDKIGDLDNSFFFALDNKAAAAGTNNLKILGHIINEASFKKFLIVGGGNLESDFTASKTDAATFNSRFTVLCHGSEELPFILNPEIKAQKSSLYLAAKVVGALAGVEPQIPLTHKSLRLGVQKHILSKPERVDAINSGVLHIKNIPLKGNSVNQSINTQQLNTFLINPDGSSPEISVERIEAQLNREIAENARVLFIGKNRSQVSPTDLVNFTEGLLKDKLAIEGETDGLIVDFTNVKAVRQGTAFFVTYDFEANTPINKVFHTGTIIDPSIG